MLKLDIKSQSLEELESVFKTWGEPAYRVKQLLKWLYDDRVSRWDEMSNLPKTLREKLAGEGPC